MQIHWHFTTLLGRSLLLAFASYVNIPRRRNANMPCCKRKAFVPELLQQGRQEGIAYGIISLQVPSSKKIMKHWVRFHLRFYEILKYISSKHGKECQSLPSSALPSQNQDRGQGSQHQKSSCWSAKPLLRNGASESTVLWNNALNYALKL